MMLPLDMASLFAGLAACWWLACAWRVWRSRKWVLQAQIWGVIGAVFALVAWLLH